MLKDPGTSCTRLRACLKTLKSVLSRIGKNGSVYYFVSHQNEIIRRFFVKKKAFFIFSLIVLCSATRTLQAFSSYPVAPYWAGNGTVRDILVNGDFLYLGGDFTYIGLLSGGGAATSSSNSILDRNFPVVDGTVHALLSDSSGAFIVGGAFTALGYEGRKNLARILPDGTVDYNLTLGTNGTVTALALSPDGNTLFLGGTFTSVGNLKRTRLAAIDLQENKVLDWAPEPSAQVNSIVSSPDGSQIYIGGSFTKVGTETRNRLAAISFPGAVLGAWNPNASSTVSSMLVSDDGSRIYAGGSFTSIADESVKYLACISSDGTLVEFAPNPSSTVSSICFNSDKSEIFLGGAFTSVAGASRKYIASLRSSDGGILPWTGAALNGQVSGIALSPDASLLYICGTFTSAASVSRRHAAALQISDGSLGSWNPSFDKAPEKIAVSSDGGFVYLGGAFSLVNGADRNYLAAIDLAGEAIASWNPSANNSVHCMALSHDSKIIYIGGAFSQVAGLDRNCIAAINSVSGEPNSWNPSANSIVRCLHVSKDGKTIYVGGNFTQIGGETRQYIASLGQASGTAHEWNPNADAAVNAIEVSPDGLLIYAGGNFKNIGQRAQAYLAALEYDTAKAKVWESSTNAAVYSLDLSSTGALLFAGGAFTKCCGQARNRIASLTPSTGIANSWNPGANSSVSVLTLSTNGQSIYVGGAFTSAASSTRYHAASLATSDNTANSWNPSLNGNCLAFAVSGDGLSLYVGGEFTGSSSVWTPYFAAYRSGDYHLNVDYGSGDGDYPVGEIVEINAEIPPEGRYFYKWTGATSYINDPNSPSTKLSMPSSNISVSASYKSNTCNVKFIAGDNGSISGKLEQTVNSGASTSSVKAVPAIDYHFLNWTGADFSSTSNPLLVKNVSSDMDITANFAPNEETFLLIISSNPPDAGSTDPSGDCQIMPDRPMLVTASPLDGWHFKSWTGSEIVSLPNPYENPATLWIEGPGELQANFAQTPSKASISFSVSPPDSGTTNPSGSINVDTGVETQISASPADGFYFYAWQSGDADALIANPTSASTALTAFGDCAVAAIFKSEASENSLSYGKIYTLDYADVPGIANFAKAPQSFAQYVKDAESGKTAKVNLKNMSKFSGIPLPSADTQWTGKVPLLPSNVWNDNKTLTCAKILKANPLKDVDGTVYASATDSNGVKVKSVKTGIVLSEKSPEIYGVFDLQGNPISAALLGQTIVVKGMLFGFSMPKAWVEYKDANGNIKKLNLKTDRKTLAFKDYAGKDAKSCMDIFGGQSEITLQFPTKWPSSWTHIGEHNIVIDNKICRATIVFRTLP